MIAEEDLNDFIEKMGDYCQAVRVLSTKCQY